MADTEFASGSAQAVKIYSPLTFTEALKKTYIQKFLGKKGDKNAIIVRLDDLEKAAGELIYYDLLMQSTGAGVTGDNQLEDYEEELVYYQDSVYINQLRNAHSFKRMSQQRTLHNLRKDAMSNLSDWFAGKYDDYMFRYLGGDTTISHGQDGVAPDTGHYIVTGDVTHSGTIATDEASLGSNDQLALADLDYAKEKAVTGTPPMRSVNIDGEEVFVVVLHHYSATDLRLNVVASTYTKWQDIQQHANLRGLKNPLFTNSLGVYRNMILYEDARVYSPTTNVRRNLFLGAQAGVFAVGSAYDKIDSKTFGNLPMSWEEDYRDYRNKKGIAAGCIFGMKACRFNSKNYGAMVITSYAAAHN